MLRQMRPTVEATRQQVLAQVVEGGVALVLEVHLHAVDEILEGAPGQGVAAGHRLQRRPLP